VKRREGARPALHLVDAGERAASVLLLRPRGVPETRAAAPSWLQRARFALADLLRRLADLMEPA
jgi:hypothetical protein